MLKKILLVDDETLILKSLFHLLESRHYTVVVAASGVQALEAVQKTNFDLIITDMRMPGWDGIETIKQIRAFLKENCRPPIPEVIISGYADADKYEEAQALGVSAYLFKPFENEEFLKVIETITHAGD